MIKQLLISAAVTLSLMLSFAPKTGAAEVIRVSTAEELMAMSDNGSYVMYNDIDLAGVEWEGIDSFSGTLNGGGHTIRNMQSDCGGLFGKLKSGAVVKNIRLENVKLITESKMLGGIVSYIPSSEKDITISDCSVSGFIATRYENHKSKLNYCGAIAGVAASNSVKITNCSSSATVEAVNGVGGLVGLNYGKISGSAFTGKLEHAFNDHSFDDPQAVWSDIYYVNNFLGGIASVNFGTIDNCCVLLSRIPEHLYAGQIAAVSIKGKGKISNCTVLKTYEQINDDTQKFSSTANSMTSGEYAEFISQ